MKLTLLLRDQSYMIYTREEDRNCLELLGKIKDRKKSMEVIFGNREPGDIVFVSEKLLTAYDTDYEIKKRKEEKIDHA